MRNNLGLFRRARRGTARTPGRSHFVLDRADRLWDAFYASITAGEGATGEIAPEAEQAVANFVEGDPYLRVGDSWATRAGRRAHAALKERLAQEAWLEV